MIIIKIIYAAIMICLFSLFFAFLECLWEEHKNNKPYS
jgi:TRAP-type C4-dicarboxylate transport system permease small subunit